MKIYYFSDTNWQQRLALDEPVLKEQFYQIADGSKTADLIVANYLLQQNSWSGGIAFARDWLTPRQFISQRGRWKFTQKFGVPLDLPDAYKLIRLHFGIKNLAYPLRQIDRYGWELSYASFTDHIAFLFAHELHHFRRFHLGLHAREGENLANKWALERVQQLNFKVNGGKLAMPARGKKSSHFFWGGLFDPYQKFRILRAGDSLLIRFDPQGRYQHQMATVVRPLRKNSRRIVLETRDGKQWRWPVEWIAMVP